MDYNIIIRLSSYILWSIANKPPDLPKLIQENFYKRFNIISNLKGQEIIKFIAKTLPHKPGVYQMENEKGDILYIGKAKNLAKRVINYTSLTNLTLRLQRMVSITKHMNFVVTNTEVEALLLECNLIKRHKPRFNIILRDDKSFPYILINKEYEYPRIQKYRGAKKFKGDYFGPFVSPSVADYTIFSLQQLFKGHAIEQKLHKEVDVDINKEEVKESLSLLLEGKKEDAFKKMGEIQETINKSLS